MQFALMAKGESADVLQLFG